MCDIYYNDYWTKKATIDQVTTMLSTPLKMSYFQDITTGDDGPLL